MNRSNQRRRADQLTVSLFPFLAVLICTMGILIVLLVISVQSAKFESDARVQATRSDQQQQLTELKDRRALMEFEAQNVESVRADVSERLAIAKHDRSYLQEQIQQLESDAREVYFRYRELQQQKNMPTASLQSPSESELDQIAEEIAATEQQIALKREQIPKVAAAPRYQIVPYTGSGGTKRRPIFIECDADGLLIQPLGIRLGKSDFVNPNLIGNVLDSALLAIREYQQKHGLTDTENKSYPLLVIRPDGAGAYALARRAMKSWDDEFGYELVDQHTPLTFGKQDPQLKRHIRTTIATAQRRQLAIASGARRKRNAYGTRFVDGSSPPSSSVGGKANSSGDNLRADAISTQPHTTSNEQFAHHLQSDEEQRKVTRANNDAPGDSDQTNAESLAQSPHGSPSPSSNSAGSTAGSLAATRGANWALPSQTTGARAYVRPIRIACEQHRIMILSQNRIQSTISLSAKTSDSIDAFVAEIWKIIDLWGIAGRDAYWKPELRFSVLPGGEQRFADLQSLLNQSGLIVEASQ